MDKIEKFTKMKNGHNGKKSQKRGKITMEKNPKRNINKMKKLEKWTIMNN